MVANRVLREEDGKLLFEKLNAVVARYLEIPFSYLGCVPQDDKLQRAVMQQKPVSLQNENAKSSRAFEEITRVMMYGEEAGRIKKRGMAAFFSHIVVNKKKTESENHKI
jgi:flagellar biosynthesis protein FlhG